MIQLACDGQRLVLVSVKFQYNVMNAELQVMTRPSLLQSKLFLDTTVFPHHKNSIMYY